MIGTNLRQVSERTSRRTLTSFGYQPYLLAEAIALDYVDTTVPEEIPISDQLWRIVKGRGGKRGYRQKVKHLVEGLKNRHYSNVYPWVNKSGRNYASSWGFVLVSDVFTGGTVWEVESSAEENEVVERPVVKAKSFLCVIKKCPEHSGFGNCRNICPDTWSHGCFLLF